MNRANIIVAAAVGMIGQTEKPGNSGFTNTSFEKKMKAVGWQKGQAWCSYLVELIWKEAYANMPEMVKILDKLCSAAATATFKNFDLDSRFKVGRTPQPGAIAIWRQGNGWQGHAGVVKAVIDSNTFACIEGNTNDKGGREGYIVAERYRSINKPHTTTGLNLVGFIYPLEI